MLREYALTPQVFSPRSFSDTVVRRLCLLQLHNELLNGPGVVRNLGSGAWETASASESGSDPISLRLLKALRERGVVKSSASTSQNPAQAEAQWIDIARAEHASRPLRGVIRSPVTPETDELVADIRELAECPWWNAQMTSWTLARSLSDYRHFFEPLFYYSREIMFVDRYLDPSEPHYANFCELLRFLHRKNSACHVWIHKPMEKVETGKRLREIDATEWVDRFQLLADRSGHPFNLVLRGKHAYQRQSFTSHERFLISTRLILSLTNGFDTEEHSSSTVSVVDRPDVRRFYESKYGPFLQLVRIEPRGATH